MPKEHEKAVPSTKDGEVVITPNLCLTSFETEKGAEGHLNVQRWISEVQLERPDDGARDELRYIASINIKKPDTNLWCGAIDLPTAKLGEILPWITAQTSKVNQQLQLEDTAPIEQALTDLAAQFESFVPTLEAEEDEIQKHFAVLFAPLFKN